MNKIKKISLLLILLLSPILLTACLWTFALGGMYLFTPTPSQPKVKTGEFPFEVVYKLNGETYIVRDAYVCIYDGVGFSEGDGKYRKWKGYVKGLVNQICSLQKTLIGKYFVLLVVQSFIWMMKNILKNVH